ncbi:MAG: tetrahydromethanopterin S-methyltransferase subunit MtrB [Candidatus Bathyarchaeota archaeon]
MPAIISQDYNIILDENYMLIGEARRDIAILDIEPLTRKVEELDLLSLELLSSLDPSTQPLISSRPRRSEVYKMAGRLTNVVIGFVIGNVVFALFMLTYLALTKPEIFKIIFGG